MKRILRIPAIAGALVAAAVLAGFTPTPRCTAEAGPVIDFLSGGYYSGYGPGYRGYPGYGYSTYGYGTYGYGTAPGYVYPSDNGYGPSYRRGGSPYLGHAYGPYGGAYSPYGAYGPSYSPYGYGVYGPYGYKLHGY